MYMLTAFESAMLKSCVLFHFEQKRRLHMYSSIKTHNVDMQILLSIKIIKIFMHGTNWYVEDYGDLLNTVV